MKGHSMDAANIEFWTKFFLWGTILNVGLMWTTVLLWRFFRPWAHRIHGNLFGVTPGTVDIVTYAYLGLWKILTVIFFLFPWLVLLIVG